MTAPVRMPRRGGTGRVAAGAVLALCALAGAARAQDTSLARQVEIRRTAYGVPHIRAQNLKAAGYGLGWVQVEDYGARVPLFLLKGRGELARWFGRDSIDSDFSNRPNWMQAAYSYHLLDRDTRDVYEGFAAGVNRYIAMHRSEFPAWLAADFTGVDALTTDMELPDASGLRRILRRLGAPLPRTGAASAAEGEHDPDEGSNAWAFAPSRTKSGKAILLRNPHLDWDAGYYEAQMTVPGVLDFYGDFRIGKAFETIGGFNRRLGWSTTNNDPVLDQVYVLQEDSAHADHVLLDGASVPLRREVVTVQYRSGDSLAVESRESWTTPVGPVVHRATGRVYAWKVGGEREYRRGQMWLRMMRAHTLAEWQDALRMLTKPSSNFTYADADGNIFYVWYGQVPSLPGPSGGDTIAIPVSTSAEVFNHLVPFDSLPQLRNPKGGYIHNENDSFHYTNLNEIIPAAKFPPYFTQPRLGLRSQLALQLVGGKEKLSLEDVVRLKHSMRMLLADRVKDELIAAVRASSPAPDVAAATDVLARWDNTVAAESRGGVLFESWWTRYRTTGRPGVDRDAVVFSRAWTPDDPTHTPAGLADPKRASEAFAWAVNETKTRFGAVDVAWGDVHRIRIDSVDVPVGGCTGSEGCFRVINYGPASDGKLVAGFGDGWILAVEFAPTPRAYSVLAYGQSGIAGNPHHSDQAAMFARKEMKRVAFTEEDVGRQTVRRYNPGLEGEAATTTR